MKQNPKHDKTMISESQDTYLMETRELDQYESWLRDQEKSPNTIEKYVRDVRAFLRYAGGRLNREAVLAYKEHIRKQYQPASVNSMLIAVNGYLKYKGREDCCVRICRIQRKLFAEEGRTLSEEEYRRLVQEARNQGNRRMEYLLQTLSMTGIRIGELRYITAETLKEKAVRIDFKGKQRVILLPKSLRKMLTAYCRSRGIRNGSIFVTRSGRAMDRRNIWAEMKRLCAGAGVAASKVYPHSLRHLFARCFYQKWKDLARLADYLGHSSLETTRRYTVVSSMEACLRQLELGLLVGGTDRGKRLKKEEKVVMT